MSAPQQTVTVLISLMLVASAVAMGTKWVRVPYTVALVVVGLLISPIHFLPTIHISPDLILMIFLPALIFEAAWNIRLSELRANLVPVLILAVAGVLLSVGVIATVLRLGAGLTWSAGILFGAMISATDPVSVVAMFRKLGLPARLTTIIEGESLLNDGTAVVVFQIVAGIVLGTTALSPGQLVWESIRQFGVIALGGLAVGVMVGFAASALTSHFDDHLLEITLTTITAYASFLLGEALHVSPVMAVLVAGLVVGNYGRRTGMSATTQVAVTAFWEYAAFVVNSLMFLLIGLEIPLSILAQNLWPVLWGVAAVLLSRAAAIYLLLPVSGRFSEKIPAQWQHVMFWGGLRGALSIALALSLPLATAGRSVMTAMVFGAVMFSLLVQGLTMTPLLRWLGFTSKRLGTAEYEHLNALLLLVAARAEELARMRRLGLLRPSICDRLEKETTASGACIRERLTFLVSEDKVTEQEQLDLIRRRLAQVQKARLSGLRREEMVSEESYRTLNVELESGPV
jgi:monovalent cation:H+ antiporter, CPA1 family